MWYERYIKQFPILTILTETILRIVKSKFETFFKIDLNILAYCTKEQIVGP